MMISTDRKLVVGLDIGTTKIITLVGEIIIANTIKIIGIGICSSKGIDKGQIKNFDTMVQCIKKSIHQAEIMADCQITSVYLSLSSKYINCQNEIGITAILGDEVTKEDIENVIHTAQSVKIAHNHQILHIIPQEYCVDQQSGIKNPIGLSGIRLQVNVHLITCHNNMAKNIIKAVEKCNLTVDQAIFSGLASSKSVLTEDERKLGVCMIDIGGGTIDCTIYVNDCIQDSQIIPYAGKIVTSDIAYAFNTSYHHAENLKIQYGAAIKSYSDIPQSINFFNIDGSIEKMIQRDTLIDVIESRYIELLSLINDKILCVQKKLYHQGLPYQLAAGIVLTGGASTIKNLTVCAEKIFQKKIRIGQPLNTSGLVKKINEPHYSTVVGLLHYAKEFYKDIHNQNKKKYFLEKWFQKINHWLKKKF